MTKYTTEWWNAIFSFTYILKHETRSLIGTSFYCLVFPTDINRVASSIREMLVKGHSQTPYYRLISNNGSIIWLQTEATAVSHTSKGRKGQYVICVHHLLGWAFEGIVLSRKTPTFTHNGASRLEPNFWRLGVVQLVKFLVQKQFLYWYNFNDDGWKFPICSSKKFLT